MLVVSDIKKKGKNEKNNYKIIWLENSTLEGKELKAFLDTLPNPDITGEFMGGNEIECYDFIKAKDIRELKKIIREDYSEAEIFSVFLGKKRILTEEDM